MPSRTLEDKVEELVKVTTALTERLNNYENDLKALTAEHAATARVVAELKVPVALLGQQIADLNNLKAQVAALGDLRINVAILEKAVEDLKKTRDEWSRRFWAMAGPILGAVVGVLLGYYLRRRSRLTPRSPAPMRRVLLPAVTATLVLSAMILPEAAADFPPVDKLPSRPELPDPLVMFNGERVTTREQWFDRRRPELKALFQHYVYGYPPPPAKVTAKVEREDPQAIGGKATLKEVTLSFGPPGTPAIHLLLVVPNRRKGPAPVFLGMNFCGNHALVEDPAVRLPTAWMYDGHPGVKDHKATEAGRGKEIDTWALEQSVDRGYAVATFYNGDVDPDRPDVRAGIQPHFLREGEKPGPHDWGTIAAWAWGLSRAVDYLHGQKDLDRDHIAVVGHSRLGKTALLAAALDERIALAIPHQAGCGGTAPSRGKVGESVKQINRGFPHWFDGTFKEFNDRPDRLPFDQNCLVALLAPRPVLFSNAVEDQWANPKGQFDVLAAADPVYRFLGAGGLDAKRMPPPGELIDGKLGYYIRPGKHSMTKGDWKVFLDFADRHFGKPPAPK